jgi:hypothetical protein
MKFNKLYPPSYTDNPKMMFGPYNFKIQEYSNSSNVKKTNYLSMQHNNMHFA